MAALASGDEQGHAWSVTLAGLDDNSVSEQVLAYAEHGSYTEEVLPLRTSSHPVDTRTMGEPEVHAARAHLAFVASEHRYPPRGLDDEAKEEVARALALEPTNVEALIEDATAPMPDRRSRLRRAVEVHPDDARVYALLGDDLAGSSATAEREALYRKSIALDSGQPHVVGALASLLLTQKRAGEALTLVQEAAKHAPFDASVTAVLARSYFETGHCAEAIATQWRTILLLQGRSLRIAKKEVEVLNRFQSSCPSAS
jgi:predicted Zn-dependent protease